MEHDDQNHTIKKRKIDNADEESTSIFSNFTVNKILREDAKHKLITVQGSLDDGKSTAVVILERKPFHSATLQNYLCQTKTLETLNNDIYSTHDVIPMGSSADMKATVINPATEKHIEKYSDHEPFIIHETSALYKNVTLPCILNSKFSMQWVYNILAKTTESDRIVLEDPDPNTGFILLPDMKWDRKTMESLYLIAIVHKHDLKSIRDLRKEHLPMLKNILAKGQEAIEKQFDIPSHLLRVYFHYQPSYYHLHIHFTHVKFEAPGTDVLRAHLIEDVINNIEIDPEFYIKKMLSFVVRENDKLYSAYKENGYFKTGVSN